MKVSYCGVSSCVVQRFKKKVDSKPSSMPSKKKSKKDQRKKKTATPLLTAAETALGVVRDNYNIFFKKNRFQKKEGGVVAVKGSIYEKDWRCDIGDELLGLTKHSLYFFCVQM